MSILFAVMYFYPIWGLALLFLLCKALASFGPLVFRILISAVVAALATFIFTPAMWGGEGFGMMVPWYLGFLDKPHAIFSWQSAALVFIVALTINLLCGGKERKG